MIKYENYCVGCPPERGCLGSACPNKNVPIQYCDKCNDEARELWIVDGYELCEDCLKKSFKKVIHDIYDI